ncbi:MAG TPA: hypothetical protein VK631_08550, partial [Solirubrobacteraceae bacterium]|nr:hypothetical protein [Solirubrobacteraceae bacterium]
MRSTGRTFICGAVVAAALAAPGAASAADFGVGEFSVATSTQQAGGHPDVTVVTAFPAYEDAQTPRVRNVRLGFPPGLIGNPSATPVRCSQAQFDASSCPPAARVGSVSVTATAVPQLVPAPVHSTNAGDVFNLEPPAGAPARLGFIVKPTLAGSVPIASDIRV